MDDDAKLMEAFVRGDVSAFEQLVVRHKGTVINTIYSVLGNAGEADDIAQEVFLKIYKSAGSFRFKSSVSTWFYRITVNRCMDELRKKKSRTISLETEIDEDEVLKIKDTLKSAEENIEEKLAKKETQETVRRMLNSLPEKYGIILRLKEIEDLSYNEIAKIMNISVDKVKVWLFRARQRLKAKFSPGGSE